MYYHYWSQVSNDWTKYQFLNWKSKNRIKSYQEMSKWFDLRYKLVILYISFAVYIKY